MVFPVVQVPQELVLKGFNAMAIDCFRRRPDDRCIFQFGPDCCFVDGNDSLVGEMSGVPFEITQRPVGFGDD